MHRRRDERRERRRNKRRALRAHAKFGTEDRLGSSGTEADDDAWLDDVDFCLQPWAARSDLRGVRLLVDALFSARLPLEVLHHIRHVNLRAVDARLVERAIEQSAGGTDERLPLQIFRVAGLLADEHHRRRLLSLTEDGLRACLPEI